MPTYENFWTVTIFRGVLAILIGSAVVVVPDLARTLLFLPFAVAFVIISLAVYGIADSVLVFITSFFTSLRPVKTALRLQSACGIVIGVLFCSIFSIVSSFTGSFISLHCRPSRRLTPSSSSRATPRDSTAPAGATSPLPSPWSAA